ncbi:THAP domain-containing protein 6 isoform X2 [Vicugna pacos]|uniref:THAP domain-containing protein 6 isoform X2 n=1 Tax=Vicugna pacos TaxID=30538 RepID=A0ABM5BMG3_VICPA
MVKCCSAIGCASRCLPNSKLKGLTFHVFPTDEKVKRKWVLAMKRLDVNAAGIWEPKKGDVLCSRHFKKTDFDRSAPNIKLKPGVIPSIFDSPSHLQGKKEKLHCRKNFTLKTLPVTNHNHQLVGASSESARLDDPSGRPDSTTVWTCYGPLSCFWPHAELAAFMSPVYRNQTGELNGDTMGATARTTWKFCKDIQVLEEMFVGDRTLPFSSNDSKHLQGANLHRKCLDVINSFKFPTKCERGGIVNSNL